MSNVYNSKLDSSKLARDINYRKVDVFGVNFYIHKKIAGKVTNEDGTLLVKDDNHVVSFDVSVFPKMAITRISVTGHDGEEDIHSYQGGRIEVYVESMDKACIRRAPGVQDKLRILEIVSLEDKIPFFEPFLVGEEKEFDSQAYLIYEANLLKKHQKDPSSPVPRYLDTVHLFLKPLVNVVKHPNREDKKVITYAKIA